MPGAAVLAAIARRQRTFDAFGVDAEGYRFVMFQCGQREWAKRTQRSA